MLENPISDLSGMLSLIPASKNPFSPIVEAFNNSLESIFKLDGSHDRGIDIELFFNDQDDACKQLVDITIRDSGMGFNDASFKRFQELLNRSKGFNNRGSGRLQYLHRFAEITVESCYLEGEKWYQRKFHSSKENYIYDDSRNELKSGTFATTIKLKNYNNLKKDKGFYTNLTFNNFISLVKSQFALRAYLEKSKSKPFPKVTLRYSYQISECVEAIVMPSDFPEPSSKGDFSVAYQTPFEDRGKIGWRKAKDIEPEKFKWCVFSFPAEEINLHGAFLCSKDIPVEEVENPILKKSNGYLGTKMVTAFYGNYLDKPDNVSHSVDSFSIKNKSDIKELSGYMFDIDANVYLDDIKEHANNQLKLIYQEIATAQENAEKKVLKLARELGISAHIAIKVKKSVKLTDDDDIITKSLHVEEAKYVADKSNKARKVIVELEHLDPTGSNYQVELESKSIELSLLIDEQNKEELSKYIVRREIVANLLKKVLNQELEVQNTTLPKGTNRSKEGIIHDLIFKRKSNNKLNDLWILDEEFVHFDSCSDIPLDKIEIKSGELLLKNIPNEEIEKLKLKTTKQPDVFLFANEGKCILVEFKAPDVNLSDYLNQTEKYCTLIANYSSVKIEKFYCYLIGEVVNSIDLPAEYDKTVNGSWLREKIRIVDKTELRNPIAYSQQEILKLSDIANRAHRRNRNFADKLGLDFFRNDE